MSLLKIERTFPASPEKVFAFVTQMENLLQWWGPKGTSIGEHNLDLSQLGDWFMVMVDPNGGRHRVSGEVLSIDPPRSVEFSLIVHDGKGGRMIDSVVRFQVSPIDTGGTHFLLTQSGLSDAEIELQSKQGWASTLSRLEELLIQD